MAVNKQRPVLVVDDYMTMARIERNLLHKIGFLNVLVATSGEDALDILKKIPDVQLILSDWNMDRMTGVQLLRHVRKDEKTAHIPFIMVTAESKVDNVLYARKEGVSNYIVKPFNVALLREKITSVLGPLEDDVDEG